MVSVHATKRGRAVSVQQVIGVEIVRYPIVITSVATLVYAY